MAFLPGVLSPQLTLSPANSPFAKVLPESRLHMPSVSRRDSDRHHLESSQEEEQRLGPFQCLWRDGWKGRLTVKDWKGLGHMGGKPSPTHSVSLSHHEGLRLPGLDEDPWSCKGTLPNPHIRVFTFCSSSVSWSLTLARVLPDWG